MGAIKAKLMFSRPSYLTFNKTFAVSAYFASLQPVRQDAVASNDHSWAIDLALKLKQGVTPITSINYIDWLNFNTMNWFT